MTTAPMNEVHADLIGLMTAHGCTLIDTPLLQPADVFLDLSGEDIRRRLFVTQDGDGRELCLRPEHTIPVCRQHLADDPGGVRDYCYLGPVFRQRANESGEFLQAGIESIGRQEMSPADADILGLALDGVARFGDAPVSVKIGDMGVLGALLGALAVPAPMHRRLIRDIAAGRGVAAVTGGTSAGGTSTGDMDHGGLLAAIEGQDPRAARRFVEDVLSIAGITRIGGRSAGEIADRFLSRADRAGGLSSERLEVIARYIAISGDLDGSAHAMRTLAAEAKLDLGAVLDRFEERTGFMAARGLAIEEFVFAADFARTLDYYSGFIFEVRQHDRVVVGGGRYDTLLARLGAAGPIPAVGCSFWLDRLGGAAA